MKIKFSKNNNIKILCLLLVVSFVKLPNIYATSLEEYEAELEEIMKEQEEATESLEGIEKEISQMIYDMIELDGDITIYTLKLEELNEETDAINEKLEEYEASLQSAALSYSAAQELYLTRLRVIYEKGIPTYIDMFFTSSSISDFFSKINVLNSILEYDMNLADNMQTQKEYIDNLKADIEIQKVQLEQLTYDAEKSAEALELAKDAKEAKVTSLNSSKELLEAYSDELAEQEELAQAKVQEEIERLQSVGSFTGNWYFPVPGFNTITAVFGANYDPWNTGVTSYHSGTDIAGSGIAGTDIGSMSSGTVIVAATGWNYGYGNYVIVDHGTSNIDGSTYKSLYAHMQTIEVEVGQVVAMGQTLGTVVTTGNSTGYHLHLELYKDNVRMSALEVFPDMNFVYW